MISYLVVIVRVDVTRDIIHFYVLSVSQDSTLYVIINFQSV